MQICKYQTGVFIIGEVGPTDYKGFKNIGPDAPHDKLCNFLKTTDLTSDYKKYDWNTFFRKLIDNHLFDIPSGQELIDAVRAKTDEYNYSTGEWATIIQ